MSQTVDKADVENQFHHVAAQFRQGCFESAASESEARKRLQAVARHLRIAGDSELIREGAGHTSEDGLFRAIRSLEAEVAQHRLQMKERKA